MNKLNKKGFTLIEMLVVIAIIAVLVSIVIPTVTSATDKAAAATNAANLRSVKAEMVTKMLTGTAVDTVLGQYNNDSPADSTKTGVKFKPVGDTFVNTTTYTTYDDDAGFAAEKNGTDIKVTFDGLTIQNWADLAS